MTVSKSVYTIALLSIFALCLSIVDMVMNWTLDLWYLPFNLLLAWIPLLAAVILVNKERNPWLKGSSGIIWLAFLPNSYYTITDIIHVSDASRISYVYDTVTFFMIALSGVLAGAFSLLLVDTTYLSKLTQTKRIIMLALLGILVGIGIYLGRILRWNSWDLVSHPVRILSSFASTFLHPLSLIQFLITLITFVLLVSVCHLLILQSTIRIRR